MDLRHHIVHAFTHRARMVPRPQRASYPRAIPPPPPYPPPPEPSEPPPTEEAMRLEDVDTPLELLAMVATLEFLTGRPLREPVALPEFKLDADVGQCTICQEEMKAGDTVRWLPCQQTRNHAFHKGCIDPWIKDHASCPTCRGTW